MIWWFQCARYKTRAGSVLDFPYDMVKGAKAALAEIYSKQGVEEIDMVMNYSLARSGEWDRLKTKFLPLCASHKYNVIVKVIFETSMLNIEQIKKATEVCISANADFVKTSTGFHGQGATIEAVKAMLEAAAGRIKVKASGGIRDKAQAKMFIDMGVSRLGVGYSSAKAILTGEKINDNDASVY